MSEKSITFNDEMMRALLADRKTVTRRPVKRQPTGWPARYALLDSAKGTWAPESPSGKMFLDTSWQPIICRYKVGDLLVVKEAFCVQPFLWEGGHGPQPIHYRADVADRRQVEDYVCKPARTMPLWASRRTIRVTSVGVERLQEITEAEAIAEGIEVLAHYQTPLSEFADVWDSICGKTYPWASNPWVWRIAFEVVKP